MTESPFSLAQCIGYLALVLGVISFLQRDDRNLKIYNALQCVAYALTFGLMHQPSAAAAGAISVVRNVLALKERPAYVPFVVMAAAVVAGLLTSSHSAGGPLPIIASIVATAAMFYLEGVQLRLCMLACTVMWLINNLLCHSIGGVLLESSVGLANAVTMTRLYLERRAESV